MISGLLVMFLYITLFYFSLSKGLSNNITFSSVGFGPKHLSAPFCIAPVNI